MTWRRRTGIVTTNGGRAERAIAYLEEQAILAVVESHDAVFEALHLTLATDSEGHVATLDPGGTIAAGPTLEEFAGALADEVRGEVTFADEAWIGEDVATRSSDPFEQPLGADIAAFADRAVVFTRASERGLTHIANQVDDVIHVIPYLDGHAVCITEGPVLATLQWDEDTRPALIIEHGAASPSVTIVAEGEPHVLIWGATEVHIPRRGGSSEEAARAAGPFIDATLGRGALVREVMKALPAAEPHAVRAALDEGMVPFLAAVGLPEVLVAYLDSEIDAAQVPGVQEVHPESFARSVRRVVTEASTSVTERAEAMRERAVAVRTRAETAFDAAEAFAEKVVLPVRQNWVSPALAVAETTLGVLALRRARRIGGAGGGALGAGGVLLLGDAVVNTVISLAPLLRRKD